ncbi:MAG: Bax inhibitor-1 family protein [Bacilli bacterium]|nr:Bax inhibitor-1 family protein [Bacilli bacterium]
MAYASFNKGQQERPVNNRVNEAGFNQSKALAKVYGYMFLGLLITGVVCFFASWFFSSHINELLNNGESVGGWGVALVASWIVSGLICIILSFVIPVKAAFGKSSLWFPYILFTVSMGVLLTAVLLTGIKFYIVGEAFGITTLVFGGMALIGWRSKRDLSIFGFIAMMILWSILVFSMVGIITLAFTGWNANATFWFNIGIEGAIIGVLLIVTMVDSWRIKKILTNAGDCENMYLYGAFVMYTDFIAIFLRVLYILAKLQRN